MGAWGVKALESDEGLEVLGMVEELTRGRDRVTADELVAAARAEGLLGDDPAVDEYLYDMTALALAEILIGDTAHLADPGFGGTGFVGTPEGTAALIGWLSQLRDGPSDREFRELRMDAPQHADHVNSILDALSRMNIESEVRVAAEAFERALLANDASRIAGFFTDDWVYVGPDGMVAKSDLIEWIASGRLAHYTMEAVGPERTVATADALLVTCQRVSTGAWEGDPYTADEWITDLWVRRGDTWKCAFSQKTPA
ncbi:nuclear transport factor 2 family protein [Glycomyces sp. NPDC047369]